MTAKIYCENENSILFVGCFSLYCEMCTLATNAPHANDDVDDDGVRKSVCAERRARNKL